MPTVTLTLDKHLFSLLKMAADTHQCSLEEECVRRLEGAERRSRYVQALVAELRADDEQRRATQHSG